ncbi:MAG: EamA family transporter [Bacteroidales bacterium]|nr:EamA family transporter [Bacteroidales bacterium]
MKSSSNLTVCSVVILLLVYLFYSTVSIATKFTSLQEFLSLRYFLGLSVVVAMLGVYAVIWQQVLKRIELTTAYMFKGISLIFVLMFSALIFNETITVWNIAGASLIVGGIVLFAKS